MTRNFLSRVFATAALVVAGSGIANASDYADRVFLGDHIITMDAANDTANAVAIRGDKIIFVGDKSDTKALIGKQTEVIELGDNALIPGLIDAHGHFTMVARQVDLLNVSSPPVGPVEEIDDIVELLKAFIKEKGIAKGEWVMAYGYDDSLLKENRHPTREDLDKASKDNPIYIRHVSGHLGVANSAALAAVGITADSPNPAGGVIRRLAGGSEPNGVLEEAATMPFMMQYFKTQSTDPNAFADMVAKAITYCASFGLTTIQDGASMLADVKALQGFAEQGMIQADIAMFPHISMVPKGIEPQSLYQTEYQKGVRVAGIKFALDGSPQGRTAWLTQPYTHLPHGVTDKEYKAYSTVDAAEYKAQAKAVLLAGMPIIVHSNGDAAIDLMLDSVEEAFAGQEIPDHRSVIIHAQLMRQDQLDRAKRLKVIPSFYSAHPFFWGDWHRLSFGDERAFGISPTGSALRKGITFTVHNDSPVVPPDMMRLLWVTVNRETRSGFVLGPDERISPLEALRAMTINAAYQYFEEDKKGSLTVGKQADLVILGADPITVDPGTIKDIPVLETIAHGQTIFKM
ncbi:amidohydrolase [Halioxenophilus sp. WMMB6]|uniref:amidohydrolase n=1 Tax=Halioxenophilus sp. WMMB6 TaxID=3073815 RepID=UPI00295E5A88|nr:amidohydrolase [Halioxenophilus sp. WMMB6]